MNTKNPDTKTSDSPSLIKALCSNRSLVVSAALVAVVGATIVLSQQDRRPQADYTNQSVVIASIDETTVMALCPAAEGHARLVCLTDMLKQAVDPSLHAKLQLPYSAEDATRWSNFPPAGYRNRIGPTLAEFTSEHLTIIKAILKEAAGMAANEGYDELEQIVNADDFLKENTSSRAGFASGNYHIALLGTPAVTGTWQLYFGGHHLAFGTTYTDGVLVGATPSFRGVEPFTPFTLDGRENQPLIQEQKAFATMLESLDPQQRTKAKLKQIYTNIIVGPQRDGEFPSIRAGLPASELSELQQALVMAAIETYVRDIDAMNAGRIMTKYRSELSDTYIAYSGTTKMDTENDYVRIDGPTVWIELSMQPGRSMPGIHPHSVWRDRETDYGGNLNQ